MRSIHDGISRPPTPVLSRSSASTMASVSPGARSATKKASSAMTRYGARSHPVHRMMNGICRGRVSVCPAANSEGRNHPSVMTAGIAPMTTLGAPSQAANAGRIVACEANARPTRKRP
jgi:hypothetical protein